MLDRNDLLLETDDFNAGIVVQKRTISGTYVHNERTKNVSFGQFNGPGPRYGTAPIPYHFVDTLPAGTFYAGNILESEKAFGLTRNRLFHIGILSLKTRLNDGINPATEQKLFVVLSVCQEPSDPPGLFPANLVMSIPSTRETIPIADPYTYSDEPSTYGGGTPIVLGGNLTRQIPSPTFSAGLDGQNQVTLPTSMSIFTRLSSFWRINSLDRNLKIDDARKFSRFSVLSVTGKSWKIQSMFGFRSKYDPPTTSTPGGISLAMTGQPNDVFYSEVKDSRPAIGFYGYQNANPDWRIFWYWEYANGIASNLSRKQVLDFMVNDEHYSFPDTTTVTYPGGGTPNPTTECDAIYWRDSDLSHTSNYRFIAVAINSNAKMAILRDDFMSLGIKASDDATSTTEMYADNKIEMIDCNDLSFFQPSQQTVSAGGTSSSGKYEEDGVIVSTCWYRWPSYQQGVATPGVLSTLQLGTAGSGILRANTDYEFAFSVLDKTTGYETNVGEPAKYRTGTADNVSLIIFRRQLVSTDLTTGSRYNIFSGSAEAFKSPYLQNVNFKEYRVYYREIGTVEWLPAGQIPFVEAALSAEDSDIILCADPIASLPGGQPGGFNDYSPLPKGQYIDTTPFQNRQFWLTRTSMHYSYRNNPLAYPVRNAVPCPKGEFVGFIAHTYPGEAEQSSRLVVFGTEETLVGRFVQGTEIQQSVRVGPDTVAVYPLEGSNFIIESWTSNTAYSGRSAVVAEGVLYYWGPQGIYKDGGVALPDKISGILEPWIDGLVDANNTDLVHCVYNSETGEVIWFFQPFNASEEQNSQALVYHVEKGTWSYWTFNFVVDNAQSVKDMVFQDDNDELSGTRIVLSVREAGGDISRPMFFDEIVYGQDMTSTSMYMVKEVTHPTATSRRLVLATGPDSLASKSGVALVIGYQKYTADSNQPDGIYTIQSSDSSSITVDRIGASNDFPAQTFNQDKYFPVWISNEHAFTVLMSSQYWAGRGLAAWNLWKYVHTSMQVDLLNDDTGSAYDLTARYYSLPGTDFSTTNISLLDNSRGNCQIFNSIPYTKDNASGQALRIDYEYTHPGGRWSLQYMGVYVAPQPASNLRFWEG